MAEAAAGLYIAGEAVETAAQVGVGAYMVAKPVRRTSCVPDTYAEPFNSRLCR